MNGRVIVIFATLFIGAHVAASLVSKLAQQLFAQDSGEPATWLLSFEALAGPIAGVAVFAAMAKLQRDKTWKHALSVVALTWCTAVPVLARVKDGPPEAWLLAIVYLLISMSMGVLPVKIVQWVADSRR